MVKYPRRRSLTKGTDVGKRVLNPEDKHILTLPFSYSYYWHLRQKMENFGEEAACPFCHPDHNINPVLFKNKHWWVTKNAFANKRACSVMLLIISKHHWRSLGQITPEAWTSFSEMIQWAEAEHNLPGGMLFLRFGDMDLNGGTIRHLHWNLWVPDKTDKVWAPIVKSEEELEADRVRTADYARRYEAGEKP